MVRANLAVALLHNHVVVLLVLVQRVNGNDMFVSQLFVQLDFYKQLVFANGKMQGEISEYCIESFQFS